MPIHITAINIYPIKSTHRVELQEALVERQGLRGDRRWMVVDDSGECLTQRDEPRLAQVQARLDDGAIAVTAPDMTTIRLTVPVPAAATVAESSTGTRDDGSAERAVVKIWKDIVDVVEEPGDAGKWFTKYLGRPARLVYMDRADARAVDPAYAVRTDDHVSFADGYPMLLASTASLGDLNRRLDAPIPMSRFRPNLVVAGAGPFEEDEWRQIRIGDVLFDVVKGCARCVVTTIDQETAHQGKEPLRTLNRFRKRDGKVYFGQNLIPANDGMVRIGDVVRIVA